MTFDYHLSEDNFASLVDAKFMKYSILEGVELCSFVLLTFSFPPSLLWKVWQPCQTFQSSAFDDIIKSGLPTLWYIPLLPRIAFDTIVKGDFLLL